jgi:hypothetical protein
VGDISPPYSWEREYREALVETDRNLLPMRIQKAEQILLSRLSVLNLKDSSTEIHALEDALRTLRNLKHQP